MKVTVLIGANAYACIKGDGFGMDVLLMPGRSGHQSLCESALELREQAAQTLLRAERMEQAALVLFAQSRKNTHWNAS